ncbi:MAG: hypothetical protein M3385_09380 [Actinomycetota bacterium]|nr:hypothetical protein [Actinomycetota bacterium]
MLNYWWQRPLCFTENSTGHLPFAITGTGPFVGPPEANRLRLFCGGFGLGDADALLLGDALAEDLLGDGLLGAGVVGDTLLAATLPLVPYA